MNWRSKIKLKIVQLNITDFDLIGSRECSDGVLATYYLINPDEAKLEELENTVAHRCDYMDDENLTDEEYAKAEMLHDCIWGYISEFIDENFITLDIDETYEIAY